MKILLWIIAIPVVILALFALARLTLCGPEKKVVREAKPMVQGIADYIVKSGVPKSLADIEELPYRLNSCNKKEVYKKSSLDRRTVQTKKEADYMVIDEKCYFNTDNRSYEVWFWFVEHYKYSSRTHGHVRIKSNKTSTGIRFEIDKMNKLTHDQAGSGFDNRSGFCRQFKQ